MSRGILVIIFIYKRLFWCVGGFMSVLYSQGLDYGTDAIYNLIVEGCYDA